MDEDKKKFGDTCGFVFFVVDVRPMSGVRCPTTSDNPMDDAMNVDDGITMKREADSLDDYNGQSAALYDALWPVFLRRRGLRCK